MEEEASKADIILHFASSDHVGAATAIKKGLERGKGGYWIHTSGTDVLLNPKVFEGVLQEGGGEGEVKVYDDWENINELLVFSGNALTFFLTYPSLLKAQIHHQFPPPT